MARESSDTLPALVIKEQGSSLVVQRRKTTMSLSKYEGEEGLRVNIGGYSEFYIGSEGEIEDAIRILSWYLENKDRVPELTPVRSSRTGIVRYGLLPEEVRHMVEEGKGYMHNGEFIRCE